MVDDLKQSGSSLSIDRFAVFDQFPYTDHLECGALLSIDTPNPRVVGEAPKTAAAQAAVVAAALEELRAFHADESATELAFAPERLSGEERNAVRKEAMALGYVAKSRGGGASRHLAVQKPPKGPAAPPKRPAAAEPSSSDTAGEEKHEEKRQKTE